MLQVLLKTLYLVAGTHKEYCVKPKVEIMCLNIEIYLPMTQKRVNVEG